jgi:hypothetical protein
MKYFVWFLIYETVSNMNFVGPMDSAVIHLGGVGLAGFCSGGILGAFLLTRPEARERGIPDKVDPWMKVPVIDAIKIILNEVILAAFVVGAMVVVSLGIATLCGVGVPNVEENKIWGIMLIIGAGCGKLVRYLIWRRAN